MSSPKWPESNFCERILFFEYSGGRRSAKTRKGGQTRCDVRFFPFTPVFAEISVAYEKCTNIDFSQTLQMQRYVFRFSFDFLLCRGSRDVFTTFLARSVRELWLIKCLPAGVGVEGSMLANNG